MPLNSTNQNTNVNIGENNTESSDCEKLLGVKIDNKLTFDCYVFDICKKASRKINSLARIAPCIKIGKRRILMNSFFKSQFNHCPLIMRHSRRNNKKINRLYKRCLRIIYK